MLFYLFQPLLEERYLKEFKRDYLRDGIYSIEGQLYHLARLAEHYEKKYETTKNWMDCVKVGHAFPWTHVGKNHRHIITLDWRLCAKQSLS